MEFRALDFGTLGLGEQARRGIRPAFTLALVAILPGLLL
jgi:hypothetical protein